MNENGKSVNWARLRDYALAGAVGVVVCVAILALGVQGLDPSLWEETAVAAGVRPPHTIFPGFWRVLTGRLFSIVGMGAALSALKLVGAVVAGLLAYFVYMITREVLGYLVRTSINYKVWRNWIVPFFSLVAAFVFGMSDPLWRIARVFSPDELRLLLCLGSAYLVLRWFASGSRWRLFPAFALMGVMAAETPFAFLLPIAFVVGYLVLWHMAVDNVPQRPENIVEPAQLPKWRMFFLFLGGLAVAVWFNAAGFVMLGGLEANGWKASDIYFRYAGGYWGVVAGSASVIGWVLGLGFCVFPLVAAARLFPMTVRDDRQMPFNFGVMLFFLGAMAVMQSGAFPAARFWTFTRDIVLVHSGFLLAFFVFCAALTTAMFGAAFAMECQRKYLEEDERKPGPLLRGVVPFVTLVLIALVCCHLTKPVEAEVQAIVDDALEQIVDECGDAKFLFTDGHLDAGIELRAAAKGKKLYALNMMAGAGEWDLAVRRRGLDPDSEDYKSAETGVPALLRVWAGEKPNGMDESALQLGFEYWKREQKAMPRLGGLVARVKGMDEAAAKDGIERAKKLSERVLKVAKPFEKTDASGALASAFSAVSWRLARFARHRNEESLADELDLSNTALKRMLSIIEYERLRTFMQLTPREGLQLSLKRADFAEARRYAAAVLRYDEKDPEANFGMGMSSLQRKRYDEAEMYLKRVLERRPEEPAVLNNLSIICRKQRKFDQALDYAKKAIKLLPNSQEVKQTLSDAEKKAP